MIKPNFFRTDSSSNSRTRRRRSQGVSRRQRKKQLNFEALEDRRVMSADSLVLVSPEAFTSYSSATPEGANQILINELQRYLQQTNAARPEIATTSIPTDPLVDQQWYLINNGQQVGNPDFQNIFGVPGEDINIAPVYNNTDITGEGVIVAVVDTALQIDHPDLIDNVSTTLGLNTFTGGTGPNAVIVGDHGTSVAGIIAAIADNGLGGAGIAPNATLVPIQIFDPAGDPSPTFGAFESIFRYEIDQIDITNNSWEPAVVRGLAGPNIFETQALRDSVFLGRPDENGDPLGVIHVFSSGNSGDAIDTSSYNGWVNSRYTIGVTAVDHDGENNNVDGTNTFYPEIGAGVLVAAPTGSNTIGIATDTFPGAIGSGILTTDLTGDDGFNVAPDPDTGEEFDRDFLADTDYTSTFNGTSAAAPQVTGVIALMLEANPNLSWRDVQEILVRSSRQNAEFTTHADGLDKAVGVFYQNSWITNQVPLFHDPDAFDPLINNALQILNPTLDPNLTASSASGDNFIHYAPTPQVLTNAAGFTVSQGRGTNLEATGFAHGVVDAELAVQLSQQWSTRNQHLPDELTFTTEFNGDFNLPAAEVLLNVDGASDLVIPGGLEGAAGFSAYWAEYFAAAPDFTQDFPDRGSPLELTVPTPNDITLETLEITFDVDGDITQFLDHVRIVLVSPNGTHSELNHYFVDPSFNLDGQNHQVALAGGLLNINGLDAVTLDADFTDPGSVDTGISTFTFSTNRFWGERSDDAIIFDPSTAEPALDFFGNLFNLVPGSAGQLGTQGWQIHLENYSPTGFTIDGLEVAWHGSPIQPETERVQGFIGIDDNQDDAFNYSRVIQQIIQFTGDGGDPSLRLGEIQNIIDPDHESMAANITVFAHHDVNANGVLDVNDVLVDQFVTGADGNYYFDLVPDDYIISLDVNSLVGLTPLDDSLTPANFLQDYQSEWAISEDFFQVWDYDANLEVPINPVTDAPFAFLDSGGDAVTYGVKDINFLLDPGAPPADEVVYTGSVIADLNGDGIFNGSDVAVPGVGVFGDVNRNGVFDAGEILATTDATGQYTLTVPLETTAVMNVGVRPPAGWTATNPTSEFLSFFVEPGDIVSDADFHLLPPAGTSTGDGTALSGIILGTVFNDSNADGVRQGSEVGLPGQTVYIDANNSGSIDAGDTVTTTNSNGSYAFANVPDGTHFLRVDLAAGPIVQTFPILDFPQGAIITAGGTAIGKDFGLNDTSAGGGGGGGGGGSQQFFDFGDLPDVYGTRLVDDGARHPNGIFFLGNTIDSETDGVPTADASGDDAGFLDEDGVVLVGGILDPNIPGRTATLEVTASRHNMFLHGWIDFNNDGDFDDTIDGISEHILANELLDAGLNDDVTFEIPATFVSPNVYARFRYGEFGLGPTGLAIHGEVEDYQYDVAPLVILGIVEDADFDDDGDTDGFDFLAWQIGFGTPDASSSDGDANNDNQVDHQDLDAFTNSYGQQAPLALGASSNEPSQQAPAAALSAPIIAEQITDNLPPELSPLALQAALESSSSPPSYAHHGPVRNAVEVASAALTLEIDSLKDQVVSVIDTIESSSFSNGRYLASVASEFVRIANDNIESLSPVLARLENAFDAHNYVRFDKQQNLSSAVKDFALDRLALNLDQAADELLPKRRSEAYSEEVLAEAFDEAFDWRII